MVRLPEDYYGKNVTKCSGGERQRVALARAFAYDPEILFFDEPLSAIDYKLRKVLERELKDIHKETGKTFMYITHSLEEAMVMSDRIGVMRSGRLVQVGTPEDIYNRPADRFVSEFMGDVNVITVMPNGNGSFEGVDVPGHFRAPVTAKRARLPGDPAGIPALRRDPGRGRQRDRRHGLQRIFAGLAHAVSGPRRRQGVRGRALAPRGLGKAASTGRCCSAGTPATPSSCRAERWLRRGLRSAPATPCRSCCSWRWASPHRWSRSSPTRFATAAQLRGVPQLHARQLRLDLRPRQHGLDLVRLVAGAGGRHRPAAGRDRLPDRLGPGARVRPLVQPGQPAVRVPAVHLRERPPLWLGPVLHQGRRARRHAEEPVRHRRPGASCSRSGDRARHGLCLPAVHAVPDDARPVDGAERDCVDAACDLGASRLAGLARGRAAARHARHPDRLPAHLRARGRRRSPRPRSWAASRSSSITHDIEIAFTYAQNWPLGCGARRAADAGHRRAGAAGPAPISTSTASWAGADA